MASTTPAACNHSRKSAVLRGESASQVPPRSPVRLRNHGTRVPPGSVHGWYQNPPMRARGAGRVRACVAVNRIDAPAHLGFVEQAAQDERAVAARPSPPSTSLVSSHAAISGSVRVTSGNGSTYVGGHGVRRLRHEGPRGPAV